MLTLNQPQPAGQPSRRLWSIGQEGWLPLLMAAVAVLIQEVGSHFAAHGQPDRNSVDMFAVVLLAVGPVVLLMLRRLPVAALWIVTGVTLAYVLLGYPYGPVFLSLVVAMFLAVMERRRLAAIGAAVALYVGCFGSRYLFGLESPPSLGLLFAVGAWLTAVLAISEVARMRRASQLEAQVVKEEEEQRRRSEERLTIARELHDVLAHHISLINVQAGVALHLLEKRPEQAQTALAAIEGASREALTELRSVLDILRQPDEAAPRTPAPGLARLTSLTAQAEAAGLRVSTRVDGTASILPAPVDAAAFRIIQEALTNVIRHAGARSASIALSYGPHELTVEVSDDGTGQSATTNRGGGNGIPGMRERVKALGGSFEAGPRSPQGFKVTASLPLTSPA
ncbi:MAG TPA: sensor histidine kinase [Dehalococcoidia bacterium]|nr:sensor histidine kinase [Dehalococcoidia bacterium]